MFILGRLGLEGDTLPGFVAIALGAAVLEIGAGSLLLNCQLMKEGFAITTLEPLGAGFSDFS
jgi:hypothetical protein